jgi:hypothetical protein
MEIDRNSTLSFLNNAEQYFDAAQIIVKNRPVETELITVKLFLLCHSFELYLKSFLRAKSYSTEKLKKEYGHNLEKLFVCVVNLGLDITGLSIDDVKQLNLYYLSKDLDYTEVGYKQYVIPGEFLNVLQGIAKNIREIITIEEI